VNEKTGKWIVFVAAMTGVAIWQSGILKSGMSGLPLPHLSKQKYLSAEDRALTAKLQPFIQCINDVDANLQKAVGEYRQFLMDREAPPSKPGEFRIRQTSFSGFKLKVYDQDNKLAKDCLKGLGEGVAMSPADSALDGAGKAFAATLEKLLPVMDTATAYYKQEDYKDDKFKKAKELDAQLTPLFERLFAASATMREIVRADQEKLHERELAAMEKQSGKTFEWHTLNGMFQARRAVDAIDAASNSGKLTAAAIQQAEQKMQTAFDGGKAYARAHPDVKTRLGNKPLWFQMEGDFEMVLTHIKELRRDVSAGENNNQISRRLVSLNDRFNGLVRNYNMIGRFSR
jgi:Protein of unknown function (DUF3829)